MIKLKNVSKFYYSKGVIAAGFTKVNLEFQIGEFVAITGESGSGKSTLLNVISGLDTYEEGEMYINGKETSHYIEKDWEDYRRKNIANIYQNFNLINSYTVYQNIELVLTLNGQKKREIKEKVLQLIRQVDLYRFRNTKVSKLSGGQKQRVAIARALAKEVPIIIADEPTGNLDKRSAEGVIKLLREIAKDKLVIIVTHNYEQVADYVTRKITMHDGKVLEDKTLKEVEKLASPPGNEYKNISMLNKLKLGIRNTFNIAPKFILLFLVYSFIVCALMGEYSAFRKEEYEAKKSGYNYIFQDTDDKRIIVKKKDKSSFSEEELKEIENQENINYVLNNDLLADQYTSFTTANQELWIGGTVKSIHTLKGKVDIGRMPENDHEIIILGSKEDYYLNNNYEVLMDKEFYLSLNNTDSIDPTFALKVVGIKYLPEGDYSDYQLYVADSILEKMQFHINQEYSIITVLFMGKNYDSTVYQNDFKLDINESVPVGKAWISEDYQSYCAKSNCLGKNFSITVDNLYYQEKKELTIDKTYNKDNIKNLLGLTNYNTNEFQEKYNGIIYINPEDYNNLFNKGTYQIGVYIKDINKIENTLQTLNKQGYDTLAIKDTLVNSSSVEAMRILKTIVTIILVITLFFICYFIIKIILKSRNSYFSIIRMLGASKKVAKQLLVIELLIVSNLAYFLFVLIAIFNQRGLLHIPFIDTVNQYFHFSDYLLLYIIITLMSYLLSQKYASKLFKSSVMNAYREEV